MPDRGLNYDQKRGLRGQPEDSRGTRRSACQLTAVSKTRPKDKPSRPRPTAPREGRA